jgi:hypothetical protein
MKEHSVSKHCPSCDKDVEWGVSNKLVGLMSIKYIVGPENAKAYTPLICLICQNCSFVRFYSSLGMGVLPNGWNHKLDEEGTFPLSQ